MRMLYIPPLDGLSPAISNLNKNRSLLFFSSCLLDYAAVALSSSSSRADNWLRDLLGLERERERVLQIHRFFLLQQQQFSSSSFLYTTVWLVLVSHTKWRMRGAHYSSSSLLFVMIIIPRLGSVLCVFYACHRGSMRVYQPPNDVIIIPFLPFPVPDYSLLPWWVY